MQGGNKLMTIYTSNTLNCFKMVDCTLLVFLIRFSRPGFANTGAFPEIVKTDNFMIIWKAL